MHTGIGLGITNFRKKTAVSEPAFYSGLFTKYGWTKGFVYHGAPKASKFYTDSAGTVPCAANADPIGYFSDISGLNNSATQATTANKFAYNVDANGVSWWNVGAPRIVWANPNTPPVVGTGDFTMIAVMRCFGNGNGGLVMTNYIGGWGTGGYCWIRDDQPTGTQVGVVCHGSSTVEQGYWCNGDHASNTPVIVVIERTAGVKTITTYQMNLTLAQTTTGSDGGFNPSNGIVLGYQGGFWTLTDVCASMLFPGILSAGDRTAVLNDLQTSFGAWSPT